MARFVTHLESAIDGSHLDANSVQTLHKGRPLWVKYDLAAIRAAVDRDALVARQSSMFRYRELLPVGDEIVPVSLGEGMSPLLECPDLGYLYGLNNLLIKDESQLPTGSFKSRGLAMAITMAKNFGTQRVAIQRLAMLAARWPRTPLAPDWSLSCLCRMIRRSLIRLNVTC